MLSCYCREHLIFMLFVALTSRLALNTLHSLAVAVQPHQLGGWVGGYNIQLTNFCRITTCNERRINRVHLTFSLHTNYQNRPCGKELNITAFVNLHIYNVYVNIILWRYRFHEVISTEWLTSLSTSVEFKYFMLSCYCREHLIFMLFVALTSRLALNTLHSLAVAVQPHQLSTGRFFS
jgi:hypothetical protein